MEKKKQRSGPQEHLKGLLKIIQDPEGFKSMIYEVDEDLIVVYDKFPKAKHHLLVIPKREIEGPAHLTKEHLPLLLKMKSKAQSIREKLLKEHSEIPGFRTGFHAIPSMM